MLKPRIALVFGGLFLMAANAGAQDKISGTFICSKPAPQTSMPVGDRTGHAFVVMKDNCTWTKPMELGGIQAKTGADTVFSEADGARSRDSGYHITAMANGDQFVVHFIGTTTVDKNGVVQTQNGTWSFVRGTGTLKGIAGKGTYRGKGAADGSVTTDVEGDYQIGGK